MIARPVYVTPATAPRAMVAVPAVQPAGFVSVMKMPMNSVLVPAGVPTATAAGPQVFASHVPPQQQSAAPPGEPRPVPTGSTTVPSEAKKETDPDFMKLLDSLEVRVDLMAQMQHTRNQIQARAAAAEQQQQQQQQQQQALQQQAAGEQAYGEGSYQPEYDDMLPGQYDAAAQAQAAAVDANEEVARLNRENQDLWVQTAEQQECIRKLMAELEAARDQEALARVRAEEMQTEVQQLQAELIEERRRRSLDEHDWRSEREGILVELRQLRQLRASDAAQLAAANASASMPAGGIASMPTAPLYAPSPVPSGSPLPSSASLAAATTVFEDRLNSKLELLRPEETLVAPFSAEMCGVNVELKEEGYLATRTRGCRQSVLIGAGPLPRHPSGWYFELEVVETVEGWVGGLGLGVTRTAPGQLRRVPDKAWRLPDTFIVGYWGCVFLNGKERRTRWRADTLPKGAHVGVLVANDGSGDLMVFVDGNLVVAAEGALKEHIADPSAEFFPVVDVFAATLAVRLLPRALPPPPPWDTKAGALSRPGSPSGSMVSVPRSMCSSR